MDDRINLRAQRRQGCTQRPGYSHLTYGEAYRYLDIFPVRGLLLPSTRTCFSRVLRLAESS
eukprot:3461131-Pyramimonas_sp.AAC.1